MLKYLTGLVSLALILFTAACSLTTPVPTPIPTPDLPQVRFLIPSNNTRVYEGVEMIIDILAEDASAGIVKIELYVDGVKINEGSPTVAAPTFRAEMNWIASGVGGHTLKVISYRADGTSSVEIPGSNLILAEVVPVGSDE